MKPETHSKIFLGLLIFFILMIGPIIYGIYYGSTRLNEPDRNHPMTVLIVSVIGLVLILALIFYFYYEYRKFNKTLPPKKKGEDYSDDRRDRILLKYDKKNQN